jgi:hypothetical protein
MFLTPDMVRKKQVLVFFYTFTPKLPYMPSIKFTDTELGFLRNHYEQELMDAEMYVAEIRRILSKFGKTEKENITSAPQKKRRGRPAKKSKPVTEVKPAAVGSGKKSKVRKPRRKKEKASKSKVERKAVVNKITAKKAAVKKTATKKTVKPAETPAPGENQA